MWVAYYNLKVRSIYFFLRNQNQAITINLLVYVLMKIKRNNETVKCNINVFYISRKIILTIYTFLYLSKSKNIQDEKILVTRYQNSFSIFN